MVNNIDSRIETKFVNGGIRRGTDILKAMALGDDAVWIGRPQIYALAVAGALGVAHMLRLLREEFEVALAWAGVTSMQDIGPHLLYRAD